MGQEKRLKHQSNSDGRIRLYALWPDCSAYLTDVMDAAEKFQAHRAFYAFREDEWDGMDYELPASLRPGQFYWLTEQGKQNKIPRNGELMKLLKKRM
ncbi:hypothetical protein BANRA_05247 [Klebsiella pneumoniae]|nr:hypothetical protein BANRA_05247 [Klebsiella pneumoniae]